MATNESFQLINAPIRPVSCHAWNKDRTMLAVSPNTNEIEIYIKEGKEWVLQTTLKEHDQVVTGLDWAPNSNRLVSCGQDRSAYVWSLVDGRWKPTLVLLRINRAATHVKWSPNEDKFAVASGARLISVCYFEKEQDWWVSKHIKKPIRSTVLSLDWHPNNVLIAAGASDFKTYVFSGYLKEIEERPSPTVWGSKMPFGQLMAELDSQGGWVHDVKFSPSGDKIAWVGHNASFSVAVGGGAVQTLFTKELPYRAVLWLNESSVVAAGHDCTPVLFQADGSGNWSQKEKLEVKKEKKAAASSAFNKFKQLDSRAQTTTEGESNETVLTSVHQNAISQLSVHTGDRNNVLKFTSTGVDGILTIWDVKELEKAVGVKIH
eukprot:Colp12_sorted_trinity150504_noHs@19934